MSSREPAAPPVSSPGPDLRYTAPLLADHSDPEVQLTIESLESSGSNLDLDPASLEPGYRYRWVYRAPVKVSRAKAKGYRIVDPRTHRPALQNYVGDPMPVAEDGTITIQDVVLMRIKESLYVSRRKDLRKKTKKRLGSEERKFRTTAKDEARRNRLSQEVQVITNEDERKK